MVLAVVVQQVDKIEDLSDKVRVTVTVPADVEAVIGLEFGSKLAPKLLANHTGLTIGYSFALYFREF